MSHIWKIELSAYETSHPYLYIHHRPFMTGMSAYIGKTPLRCARFLNMTLAMARRYEQSAYPKSATPDSPE